MKECSYERMCFAMPDRTDVSPTQTTGLKAAMLAFGLSGFALGALAVMVPLLVNQHVAASVSQYIYDCGIRIAADVTDANISGAQIAGHRYGVCVDVN
jgi:hypothetical protein